MGSNGQKAYRVCPRLRASHHTGRCASNKVISFGAFAERKFNCLVCKSFSCPNCSSARTTLRPALSEETRKVAEPVFGGKSSGDLKGNYLEILAQISVCHNIVELARVTPESTGTHVAITSHVERGQTPHSDTHPNRWDSRHSPYLSLQTKFCSAVDHSDTYKEALPPINPFRSACCTCSLHTEDSLQ
jgi:hypothetical protein